MSRRTAGAIIVTVAALAMLAVAALSTQGCSGAARAPLDVGPTPIPSEPLTPADEPETPISEPEPPPVAPPAEPIPEPEPPPSGGDTPGSPPPATPGSDPPPSETGSEPGTSGSTPPEEGDPDVDLQPGWPTVALRGWTDPPYYANGVYITDRSLGLLQLYVVHVDDGSPAPHLQRLCLTVDSEHVTSYVTPMNPAAVELCPAGGGQVLWTIGTTAQFKIAEGQTQVLVTFTVRHRNPPWDDKVNIANRSLTYCMRRDQQDKPGWHNYPVTECDGFEAPRTAGVG